MNRPRPVITTASIVGVATGIAGILAFLGYSSAASTLSGEAQGIGSGVIGLIAIGSHLVAGFTAQSHVTPLADPKNAAGETLAPAKQSVVLQTRPSAEPVDDTPIPLDPELKADVSSEATSTAPAGHTAEHAAG